MYISAALSQYGRRVERQDIAEYLDGMGVRFRFLAPCALIGLLFLYTGVNGLLTETDVTRTEFMKAADSIVFAVVSNAAYAAGLWNQCWRQKMKGAV